MNTKENRFLFFCLTVYYTIHIYVNLEAETTVINQTYAQQSRCQTILPDFKILKMSISVKLSSKTTRKNFKEALFIVFYTFHYHSEDFPR